MTTTQLVTYLFMLFSRKVQQIRSMLIKAKQGQEEEEEDEGDERGKYKVRIKKKEKCVY